MSDLPSIEQLVEKHVTSSEPAVEVPKAEKAEVIEKSEVPKASGEPAVEKQEAAKPPQEKRDAQSARFAALARKEKETRSLEQQIKQREAQIAEREAKLLEQEKRREAAKKHPLDLLKEHGYSYSDATEAALGGWKPAEADPLDEKLKPYAEKFDRYESNTKALEAQLEQLKAQVAQKEQAEAYKMVVTEIDNVLQDKDKYELINTIGDDAKGMVRDVIAEYARKNGQWMDYAQACDIVEEYYENEYLAKIAQTKKLAGRLPKPEPKPVPAPVKPKSEKVTLTNSMTSGTAEEPDIDSMNPEDALKALMRKKGW